MTPSVAPGVAVIVLAKHADEAKRRLGLSREAARRTAIDLADRTVRAVLAAGAVDSVSVVTRDRTIARNAVAAGADVVWEGGRSLGMDRAAELGRRRIMTTRPGIAVMVMVADLPHLQPTDIDAVIHEFLDRGEPLLVPDRCGEGSTALVGGADHDLGTAFEQCSAAKHLRLGYQLADCAPAGLRTDLDTQDDLARSGFVNARPAPRVRSRRGADHSLT